MIFIVYGQGVFLLPKMPEKPKIKVEYKYELNPVQVKAGIAWHCQEIKKKLKNEKENNKKRT